MAKTFRVAVLGSHKAEYYNSYGLQVFDLAVDQICSLLEKPDPENGMNTAEMGVQPVMTYSVFGGGRFFPMVSREEVSTCMQGVEMLIAIMPVHMTYIHFTSSDFFNCLLTDSLLNKCKFVVARIVDNETKEGRGRRGRRSQSSNDMRKPDNIMKRVGLEASKLESRLVVMTDDSLKKSKSKKKSKDSKESNLKNDIASFKMELVGEEVKIAVVQPVKETLSAGKTLINAGQRLGRWFSSLVKSQ